MKRVNLLIIIIFSFAFAYAQENDTAVLIKNHVSQVDKYIFIHAFTGHTDTCLVSTKKFDKEMNLIYDRTDMGCYGYQNLEEGHLTYENGLLSKVISTRNDEKFSISRYSYSQLNQVQKVVTFFYQTNDSTIMIYKYFPEDKAIPDSSITIQVSPDGDTSITKTLALFNKQNNLVEVLTIDQDRKPLQRTNYDVSEDGTIHSIASTSYGDVSRFDQTFYKYNKKKQVDHTYNTANQKQQYTYKENGLLKSVINFDPGGKMESEFIYKYQYR